jgi:predicted dehydrogenase
MARTHHLPALISIRDSGGLKLANGDEIVPEPVLIGRQQARIAPVATAFGIERFSTDLEDTLHKGAVEIYFDAATPAHRHVRLMKAIQAGCHVYSEKPLASDALSGRQLVTEADRRGRKHGVVEDKLHLPGIAKLRHLARTGFFGRIHRFQLEFGNWIFDGKDVPCQRASWNYQKQTEGGIVLDMFSHWRYLIEDLVGPIQEVSAVTWTATPERIDESGRTYAVDVEDSCSCLVSVAGGINGTVTSSWATRIRRDDIFSLQVHGNLGSAVASYHRCHAQSHDMTAVVSSGSGHDPGTGHAASWAEVPDLGPASGSYLSGWTDFLLHVFDGTPLRSTFREGVRDVLFATTVKESAEQKSWVSMQADT